MPAAASTVRTIGLLLASNVFMTFAWYGHLKFKNVPLWKAILASWFVALFEYCLQVPANRWGHGSFSASQLKIMQEVITLMVFAGFSTIYLGEQPRWNHLVAFALVVVAVFFAFLPGGAAAHMP
ncbi:MAG: DMT family protein [Candidatus Wallbacteria bacterium]|nr:DMT family protein [Candidatus Wallbacteria bacterium]